MEEVIRVVMFGKTGVGKSLLGNNILGRNTFSATVSAQSVTKNLTRGERMIDDNCKLVLVDTPGLFDTSTRDNMETAKILARTVKETKPGPHVFIFVLFIGRFTAEERATVEFLKDLFGSNVTDYLIIVFTGKDSLDYDKKTLSTYIKDAGEDLKSIVRQCQGKMTIDNRGSPEDVTESVNRLLKMIKGVYRKNEKQHYTDECLAEAKKTFEEKLRKQEEVAHRRERELESETENLRVANELILTQHETEFNRHRLKYEKVEEELRKVKEKSQRLEREKTDKTNSILEDTLRENLRLESELQSQKSTMEKERHKMEEAVDLKFHNNEHKCNTLQNENDENKQVIKHLKEEMKNNETEITHFKQRLDEFEQKKKNKCTIQ